MRYNAENILQQNEGEKKMAAMTKKEKMRSEEHTSELQSH